MEETVIDELRRIMAKASSGGSIAPDVEQVIRRLHENDQAIRLQALHFANGFPSDSPSAMIAWAKEFEEYLRA